MFTHTFTPWGKLTCFGEATRSLEAKLRTERKCGAVLLHLLSMNGCKLPPIPIPGRTNPGGMLGGGEEDTEEGPKIAQAVH